MGYYHRFVEAYPTVRDLAAASEDDVLRLWQGLGYYSRGRNLLRAARMIVEEYEGEIPRTLKEIARLPGVGPYTQAAILSFAYDLPHAAVDGNVYRVLSRLDACPIPIDTPAGQRHYRQRAQGLLNLKAPGEHNQAMIELGALVCTPRSPQCGACPMETFCLAREEGTQTLFPVKQGKARVTERHLHYIYIRIEGGDTLIRRRGKGDIWQGLYELPLIETETAVEAGELFRGEAWRELETMLPGAVIDPAPRASCTHRLTHRLLHATLYEVHVRDFTPADESDYIRISTDALADYAMPRLIDKLLQRGSLD